MLLPSEFACSHRDHASGGYWNKMCKHVWDNEEALWQSGLSLGTIRT